MIRFYGRAFAVLLILGLVAGLADSACSSKPPVAPVNAAEGIAVKGYDPVAYRIASLHIFSGLLKLPGEHLRQTYFRLRDSPVFVARTDAVIRSRTTLTEVNVCEASSG